MRKRVKSALVILKNYEYKLDLTIALVDVINEHCLECLRYMVHIIDFEDTIIEYQNNNWYEVDDDLAWAIENADIAIRHGFLDYFLAITNVIDLRFVEVTLERMTDDEARKSYREHRRALANGTSFLGRDYSFTENAEEVTALFEKRLKL